MQRYREMEQCQKIAATPGNGAVSEKKEKEPVLQQQFPEEEFQVRPPAARSPLDEMLRHNREMKKVRSFIRKRVRKKLSLKRVSEAF